MLFTMFHKSKIRLAALVGIILSALSLLVHLILANYSASDFIQSTVPAFNIFPIGHKIRQRRLWLPVSSLEALQPYANPRGSYPVPPLKQNGLIYAKIFGGFEDIRSSICDLVVIARFLNATLVIPEIDQSLRSKGISPMFKSFSYIYNEDHFISTLSDDVLVIKSLPNDFKDPRKRAKFPVISPQRLASPSFYSREVLSKLKRSKVVRLLITGGGCLESILPPSMTEYQRLRCRVAFHALQFRTEIQGLGKQLVKRLQASGPYISFHPGLVKDRLAFHGCAEIFQDVHTELIRYRRKQMIKRGTVHANLTVDSVAQKANGSCPLMPEEIGLLLRAMGYPPNTIIYIAGAEMFGGQRVLVPLRAMYANLFDRTSLCTKKELSNLIGPEYPLPLNLPQPSPMKSEEQLIEEWKNATPRPRPLPPPPGRPFYQHEKEGWYGWITETDTEPDPSPTDLREQAHRLIWDALDYYVSVEADAFFPGFNNDGSGWPDFSSLVMGHRLYLAPSGVTYRPDRKVLVRLFSVISDNLYHPMHNWTVMTRDHLNRSLNLDGYLAEAQLSKPSSFLSHPFPECSCQTTKSPDASGSAKYSSKILYEGEDECPEWMIKSLDMASIKASIVKDGDFEESELLEDQNGFEVNGDSENGSKLDGSRPSEQDEEMDPDD